jgi:hypothetical protein
VASPVDEESAVLYLLVRPTLLHVLLCTGLVPVRGHLQPLCLLDLSSSGPRRVRFLRGNWPSNQINGFFRENRRRGLDCAREYSHQRRPTVLDRQVLHPLLRGRPRCATKTLLGNRRIAIIAAGERGPLHSMRCFKTVAQIASRASAGSRGWSRTPRCSRWVHLRVVVEFGNSNSCSIPGISSNDRR